MTYLFLAHVVKACRFKCDGTLNMPQETRHETADQACAQQHTQLNLSELPAIPVQTTTSRRLLC